MGVKWFRDGTIAPLVSTPLNQLVVVGETSLDYSVMSKVEEEIKQKEQTRAERSRSPDGDRGLGVLGRSHSYSFYKNRWQMFPLDRLKGAIAFLRWMFAPLVSTSLNQLVFVGETSLDYSEMSKVEEEIKQKDQTRAERSRSPDRDRDRFIF